MTHATPAVMVVMERGSQWPTHIEDLTNVVGLSPDGADLLERTAAKIDALGRKGQCVRVAVLACNAATDRDVLARRAALARTLVGVVRRAAHGQLILSATDGASPKVRHELLSLAEQLTDGLRGSSASVHLWFTEPSVGQVSRLAEIRRGSTLS